jgi:hypothetical protein
VAAIPTSLYPSWAESNAAPGIRTARGPIRLRWMCAR